MNLMSLDALGVTSTDGVTTLLATLLAVSPTPATLLLENWPAPRSASRCPAAPTAS